MHCVFYYVGKAFCGGQEQLDLKPSQFVREYNPDHYTYVENGVKNQSTRGGSRGKLETHVPPPPLPPSEVQINFFFVLVFSLFLARF